MLILLFGSGHQAQHNAGDRLLLSDAVCRILLARGSQMGCNWYKVPKGENNDSDLLRVHKRVSGDYFPVQYMSVDRSATEKLLLITLVLSPRHHSP